MPRAAHQQVQDYDANPLIEACGPLPSDRDLANGLTQMPPLPGPLKEVPLYVRRHQVMSVKRLHIPTIEEINLASSIQVMVRQGYVGRDPKHPKTWEDIYASETPEFTMDTSDAAYVVGISGVGKTSAVRGALSMIPQVVTHTRFPTMASGLRQIVWLKVDAPASGTVKDLAVALMAAMQRMVDSDRFSDVLHRPDGKQNLLPRWLQGAKTHFLGLLVIDEIQNLFKIQTLRRRRQMKEGERLELRIIEDETLKFLLNLTNTSGIPTILMGTPDGVAAISKRFSAAQRMTGGGFHKFRHSASPDDQYFAKYLFPRLFQYQWFDQKFDDEAGLRRLVHRLSGGVPRIYIHLWRFAHICAFNRKGSRLEVDDFERAMDTYLAPLRPAIQALMSQDPQKLSRFEDLLEDAEFEF